MKKQMICVYVLLERNEVAAVHHGGLHMAIDFMPLWSATSSLFTFTSIPDLVLIRQLAIRSRPIRFGIGESQRNQDRQIC